MKKSMKEMSMQELTETVRGLEKKNRKLDRWRLALLMILGGLIGIIIILGIIGFIEGYFY